MNPLLVAVVRHALTILGASLGASGLESDSNVQTIVGVLVIGASLAHSVYDKRNKAKAGTTVVTTETVVTDAAPKAPEEKA